MYNHLTQNEFYYIWRTQIKQFDNPLKQQAGFLMVTQEILDIGIGKYLLPLQIMC